ncbi:hypothetical protein D3C78_1326270 [compost metagenome]
MIVVFEIENHEGDLLARLLCQVPEHTLAPRLIRCSGSDGIDHLTRRSALQTALLMDTRDLFEACQPIRQLTNMRSFLCPVQRGQQQMTDFAVEQAQRQGLPVAVAEAFSGIVGVRLQQVTLLHPDPFQRILLLRAGRPGVAEKLKLGQPCKQGAVVIRQLYILMWLEQPLRVIDHTAPAGREDQRRSPQIVGVAHESVKGRVTLFVAT